MSELWYRLGASEKNLEENRLREKFRFVEASIADADLSALLEGVTHVFHLAAQAGVRKSWGKDFSVYTVNNIEATQVLLEACVGTPIERLVYASSSSVYGDNVAMPMRNCKGPPVAVLTFGTASSSESPARTARSAWSS